MEGLKWHVSQFGSREVKKEESGTLRNLRPARSDVRIGSNCRPTQMSGRGRRGAISGPGRSNGTTMSCQRPWLDSKVGKS